MNSNNPIILIDLWNCHCQCISRDNDTKKLGKYRKIKELDPIIGETCPICLDQFKEGTYKRTLVCNHIYHKKCIDGWLKRKDTCPVCRRDVISSSKS